MTGLITNESAIVALQTLRSVTDQRDEVSQRIATGLEVRRSSDSPAFFLVSNQVRGDQAVINGIRDNLQLSIEALATAQAGTAQIGDSLDIITELVTTADTGIAIDELQFAIDNEIAFIRSVLDASSFNGVNLLSGSENVSVTTSVSRDGGVFSLGTTTLGSLNLDDNQLFGQGSIFDGTSAFMVGTTARAEAEIYFQTLIRVYDPLTALRFWDTDNNGSIAFPDFDNINEPGEDFQDLPGGFGNFFSFDASELSRKDAIYFSTLGFLISDPLTPFLGSGNDRPGFVDAGSTNFFSTFTPFPFTFSLGAMDEVFFNENDRNGDGSLQLFVPDDADDAIMGDTLISFKGDELVFEALRTLVVNPSSITFDEVSGIITYDPAVITEVQLAPPDISSGSALPAPDPRPSPVGDPLFLPSHMIDEGFLLQAANGSGFVTVLDQFDLTNPFFDAQDALILIDSLRTRLNLAENALGVMEKTLLARQSRLSDLSDSLDIGVSALIEADLDEESARIQALLVQQQLAVDALAIASVQPQLILTLF